MMLKYSFKLEKEAKSIENAVKKALEDGYRTVDLIRAGDEIAADKKCGCSKMGDIIASRIE